MIQPSTFEQAFDEIVAGLRRLMVAKQADYGPDNISEGGELGVLVRANDKMARLRHLYGLQDGKAREPINEGVDDSWVDLANYGIIALLLRRGLWGLPLEADAEHYPGRCLPEMEAVKAHLG